MICDNATGTHKILMLLIGKSEKCRCFKIANIPLMYKKQRKAWMDNEVFVNWYDNTCVSEVKNFYKNVDKENGKMLLVIDNAPSHPSTELLEQDNGLFSIAFLPPNITSIFQPIAQSVITSLKKFYRKNRLHQLLSAQNYDVDSIFFPVRSISC